MDHGTYDVNGQTMEKVRVRRNVFIGGFYEFSVIATGGFCVLGRIQGDSWVVLVAGREIFVYPR